MALRRFPPGPEGGLFGRRLIEQSLRDPIGFMTGLATRYGDIVHFRNGLQHVFLLNHPDSIRDVLFTHYSNFLKGRGITRKSRLLGEGLITSEGEFHRRQRQRTAPAFHKQRVDGYGAVMVDSAESHTAAWRSGQVVEILHEMRRLTMAIIGRTMFSFEDVTEIEELNKALENGSLGFRPFKPPLPRWADALLPASRRARKADTFLEAQMCRMITERRRAGAGSEDLLSMILEAHGEQADTGLMENIQVRDEALTIFLAGYETTATALMWTWYLLGRHPEVEAKLHEELDSLLDSRPPSPADLPRLRYTEKVFAEAMRLYPPVWRLVRLAVRDYEVEGYVVPAGSLVVVSQFLMHRDARYFPNPLRFDPERWSPDSRAAQRNGAYFPFGGGPRRCIGESFAWMEGILVLATLARKWRFKSVSDKPVEFDAVQLLRSRNPIKMALELRTEHREMAGLSATGQLGVPAK